MEALETMGPEDLRRAMVAYRDLLRAHQDRLNRLNVYPVPDGDTGTNMALTLESVVSGLDGVDAAGVGRAVTHGSLMGARGNSGVILSQILKGLADALGGGSGPAGAEGVTAALLAASRAADTAVLHPVEGTILTVARDAAGAAHGDTVVRVLEAASAAAAVSLEETPTLLPVLAEAGVVDAGGAGYCLLLDALLHVADGRPLPEAAAADTNPSFLARLSVSDTDQRAKNAAEGGRYEVMYFLETLDEQVEGFKQAWDAIGDSIVVVGGEGLWNCHIHTDDIGAAVEAALDTGGRPKQIRVTDLHQQVADEAHHRVREHLATAVVAVGAGAGVAGIMRSLGVQEVVAGGQSMNPSTAQMVEAIDATNADEVIVLPNNKNVVPVAEQAVRLGGKPARVVPTKSVAEGLASLLAYDPTADADTNMAAMVEAATQVAWGEVTQAVRDAGATPAGPVKDGDWLGLDHGAIAVVDADLAAAACGLLDRLVAATHEIVTVIEGDGASEAVTRVVTGWLAEHRPGAAAEVHHGGQPLSAYLFSAE